MKGFPKMFKTKHDILVGLDYCKSYTASKPSMIRMLENLKKSTTMKIRKESSMEKSADDLTPDDFEDVYDPNCLMARMGLTTEEIDDYIKEIS